MKTGNEQLIIDKFNSMSINEARYSIAKGDFGHIGGPEHSYALSLLAAKEAALRDARESESLSISRKALRISYAAIIMAVIAIISQIIVAFFIEK